jgi:hypothetical protein
MKDCDKCGKVLCSLRSNLHSPYVRMIFQKIQFIPLLSTNALQQVNPARFSGKLHKHIPAFLKEGTSCNEKDSVGSFRI